MILAPALVSPSPRSPKLLVRFRPAAPARAAPGWPMPVFSCSSPRPGSRCGAWPCWCALVLALCRP